MTTLASRTAATGPGLREAQGGEDEQVGGEEEHAGQQRSRARTRAGSASVPRVRATSGR